jgi:hypothetical protein
MRRLYLLAALGLVSSWALAGSVSHCGLNERTYFSCTIAKSNKVVSLCGEMKPDPDGPNQTTVAWLQYRFGPLGAPEITYPQSKANSIERFSGYWSYSRFGKYEIYQVMFSSGDFKYIVRSIESGAEEPEPFLGVEVHRGLKVITRLPCSLSPPPVQRLREITDHVKSPSPGG